MNTRSVSRSSSSRGQRGEDTPLQWLPESVREAMARHLSLGAGASIIVIAGLCLAALLTYNAADPSWSTASSPEAVQNVLGLPGSYIADILRQFFGLASYGLCVVLAAWGWRIAQDRGLDHLAGRSVMTLIALVSLGTALSSLFPGEGNIVFRPLGGAFGHIASQIAIGLLPQIWGAYAVAGFALLVAFGAFYMACALTIDEWRSVAAFLRAALIRTLRIAGKILRKIWRNFIGMLRGSPLGDEESASHLPFDEEEFEEQPTRRAASTPAAEKPARKPAIIRKAAASARQARLALEDHEDTELPPLHLLQMPEPSKASREMSQDALERNARALEGVLGDFGVEGQITKVSPGPVVTLYELEPAPGIRASRVIALADDIARSMSAASVRVAVVPGRNVIGIELPNQKREMVLLRELLASESYSGTKDALPLVLGKDIAGLPIIADLARMPHLLVAGTTGSGKSVSINTMILSLVYHLPPQKCRFIMVDPKMLELSVYDGIPHLLAPVVTEPKKAIVALKWVVREMEDRYRAMSQLGVRNIGGFNLRLAQARENDENLTRQVQTGYDPETGKPIFEEQPFDLNELPYIVVIVDEMADLMLVAGKEIEICVQRLAQMARAAGIHMIMATQRPSVDVITGTIKANFPTRISFQVTSKIDSRTILGEQGAEQLLGQGDMLYMAGGGRVTRVHGPYVRDSEVEAVVKFLKAQGEPEYLDEITDDSAAESGGFGGGEESGFGGGGNDLYDKAVDIVLRERKASTSFIQRQLQIGYNKAANLIERMEKDGIVSPANHVGKREIYGRKPDDD